MTDTDEFQMTQQEALEEARRLDEAIWMLTGDMLALQQRIINCQNLDDFTSLQTEIRTKWDADAASGREIYERAVAAVKAQNVNTHPRRRRLTVL